MKLLIITNNPDRASFRQRIAVYVDTLKTNGIDCEVAKLPPGVLSRRKLFIKTKDFDAVFLHKKTLNPFDAHCLKKHAKKTIYDFDDAIMFDDKNPEKIHRKRQNYFRRTAGLADLIIAGNEYLAGHARKFNDKVSVLPTGLNVSEYDVKVPRLNDGEIRLVWIGSRPTLPNLKQISLALEKIGKRFDNVILRIISDVFFDLQNMKVEKLLWSQQTEIADLVTGDIGLAPLADNNFTRGKCGFKILQYAAAGLPTVASPVGVNAEIIQAGVNGFHAETINDWIEKISALARSESLRLQMGRSARQLVAPFDLTALASRLISLIKKTIENS